MFDLKKLKYKDPILLSGTDGVGTKLKVALDCNYFEGLGFDLVAMCVNDILVNGGEPLFFLDYISTSKLNEKILVKLLKSINFACVDSGCALVGGETAEMPGFYNDNDFDIAGFCVGVVERKNLITKNNIKSGDLIFGIRSNGFHSNGFSLIRKIINEKKIRLNEKPPYKSFSKTLGKDLLKPTMIYTKIILPAIKKNLISCMAHITGGGIFDNIERVIPENLQANISMENYKIAEEFLWLAKIGNINFIEMLKTFNCGIGLVIFVKEENKVKIKKVLSNSNIELIEMGIIKKNNAKPKVNIKKFGSWL